MLLRLLGLAAAIAWLTWTADSFSSELWSTLPGTNTRNELEYIQRGEMIYKPLPGTRTPDRGSDDRWIIRDNKVYKAIPGTNVPDYGSRKYITK
jgi:hypothetical protein